MNYQEFLKDKIKIAPDSGFDTAPDEVHPILKPHQKDIVLWAVRGGRRAVFASFGLGKTMMQLEIVRITREKAGGMGLIVAPLGVRQEFMRDAVKLDIKIKFIRRIEEADDPEGIYITNYETVRDGKLDPRIFTVASLDEASCLRGFGGTKTFREFMGLFAGDYKTMNERIRSDGVKYRFVATATPSPNEYIELLAYSAFLGVMDVSQAKTRFFKRDSTKADKLTIHAHKEEEFWLWVSSWGLFIQKPSDIGYSDVGYALPEMEIHWHEIPDNHEKNTETELNGQYKLLKSQAVGLLEASKEKRDSLSSRIEKMLAIRNIDPSAHRIIWHDLENERHAIEKAIPECVSVYGSQDLDEREEAIIKFSDGKIQELAAKPVIAGSGCNFQRHCAWAIFLGIGYKFNDFIQAIHRIFRYLQEKKVRIDIIHTESERAIKATLLHKWEQHKHTSAKMAEIIKQYGLSHAAIAEKMKRRIGVERLEVNGKRYRAILNDCILETKNMEDNSIDLILTSIPFSTQYEYSPNYSDLGHTDNNEHFFKHFEYLTPNLLRILKPGRVAAIHVKDRIVPGGLTGLGYQTVYPFHAKCIDHFIQHGFGYMGMKTIVTDVVRENNQTYRLGWSEQCKDGTKMGVGMPEYLLLFRKTPTDTINAYADNPVLKNKQNYTRSRWQVDAHGFTRSSGNRLLTPEELEQLPHEALFKWFRDYNLQNIYDFEHHVKVGESLDEYKRLPTSFMLLQPPSWSDEVWSDVARMRTLNMMQEKRGQEQHLCPLQFDICDRVIEQFSMKNETVLDPFGGIMSVPYRAILKERKGIGIELSDKYFYDGCYYLKAAEEEMSMPSLFETEGTA
ncbi:MAG: DNA methylase N-4 [Spirochaetaceae bacterium]|nr:DNA methylase N-4 [Spirochaetaceae bacterium]